MVKANTSQSINTAGLTVFGDEVSYYDAKNIVTTNSSFYNVFAMTYSDAAALATYAYGNGFTNPEAHRDYGRILNMQHIHALLSGGIHGKCHIFFAVPVII